jgi:hypothetical protein
MDPWCDCGAYYPQPMMKSTNKFSQQIFTNEGINYVKRIGVQEPQLPAF